MGLAAYRQEAVQTLERGPAAIRCLSHFLGAGFPPERTVEKGGQARRCARSQSSFSTRQLAL
jgi:hypothetical protein